MKLSTLLAPLTANFTITSNLGINPTIQTVQFTSSTPLAAPGVLYLQPDTGHLVDLLISQDNQLTTIGTVDLGHLTTNIAVQKRLLSLLQELGHTLIDPLTLQAAVTQLAMSAITADFDSTLKAGVALLQNPLAIIDLNGQILSRSHTTQIHGTSIHAAVETNKFARWLLDHGFAPKDADFLHQVYMARDNISNVPMLITPLANGKEPLGYLVMTALKTPLDARQALLLNQLGQVITGSIVKNQIMPTAESQRDQLVNMLLTERQSSTFAAQFTEQKAELPHAMVLVKCEPLTGQTPLILQQRLQYLLAPHFKQVLVSTFQQQCVALVTVSLPTYNCPNFKAILTKVTKQADCRLIVSQHYVNPEDTLAALTVCNRTAKLKTYRGRVVFCEDQFYNLALNRVNHIEILPFFINPALRELLAYDAKNKTALVETLDAYLRVTCNLTQTAKNLYVHPNTLRNRLNHIATLTGCNLRDAETCFKLASAFKLQHFLIRNKYSPTAAVPDNDPQPQTLRADETKF